MQVGTVDAVQEAMRRRADLNKHIEHVLLLVEVWHDNAACEDKYTELCWKEINKALRQLYLSGIACGKFEERAGVVV